ncbi:MAG: DUF4149 domain-containing protein [Burkholderiaceae bacterium]
MFARTRLLIATLWVGSGWTIGYLVAPTLFATLPDSMQAGGIAGSLFRVEAWLTVACALALLVLLAAARRNGEGVRTQVTLVAAMLACTLVGYFGLQPFMAVLREAAAAAGGMSGDIKTRFGLLHGVASLLHLAQSLLGVALILQVRK